MNTYDIAIRLTDGSRKTLDWRHPNGKDIHCNSFEEYFKETLF